MHFLLSSVEVLLLACWTVLSASPLARAHGYSGDYPLGPGPHLVHDYPNPNIDPFYQVPPDIAGLKAGQVIRSRQVLATVTGRSASTYQVLYRTTNNQNKSAATVGTIFAPVLPLYPPKVLSFNQAEDAVNIACAPSWAWVNSSSLAASSLEQTDFVISWALQQGYFVVVPDQEGPKSEWLVGLTEGRATLDGIRSVIDFLRLPERTQATLLGYSGGGHTSVWASSLAESYAPELNIVGAAFGGTPVDLGAAYTLLNSGPNALLAGGALIGLANGYPELNQSLQSTLTPNGTEIFSLLQGPGACINAVSAFFAGISFNAFFTTPPLNNSVLQSVLARESLLANTSSLPIPVPKFPRYQWHGLNDTTVPYAPEAEYVSQQCARGADIRFVSFPGLSHSTALIAGLIGALQFVEQAFSGSVAPSPCGANITVPAVGSQAGLEILGSEANIALKATFVTLSTPALLPMQ